jgi:hypothetical protein
VQPVAVLPQTGAGHYDVVDDEDSLRRADALLVGLGQGREVLGVRHDVPDAQFPARELGQSPAGPVLGGDDEVDGADVRQLGLEPRDEGFVVEQALDVDVDHVMAVGAAALVTVHRDRAAARIAI